MQGAAKFDKFTERARRVLTLAQEESFSLKHMTVGSEHLLLALVRENDGVAARVLMKMGVQLFAARKAVESLEGRDDASTIREVGLTPIFKKIVDHAIDEARRLNHHYVGTEHLLLGIFDEEEAVAITILQMLHVDPQKVKAELLEVLSRARTIQ